jgi:S-adenosylmethionine uptake transporter
MTEQRPNRAMGLMIIAMLILPGIDAIAKSLGDVMSSAQITWSRFFVQSLMMLPLCLHARLPFLGPNLTIHALRGALLGIATALFFHGLKYLELADAISIFFIEPLILTALSTLFLGEHVGWRRMMAVLVGFSGALIVIRPSFVSVGWPSLLPVGAAFCFACYLALTRHTAVRDYPARMQFFSGLFGCLFMSVLLAIGELAEIPAIRVVEPTLDQWLAVGLLGLIGTTGHLLVVNAFKLASASLLAPFQYLELVGATLLGWWIFNELPDGPTVLGAAIIVGSGLYVVHRERVVSGGAQKRT